MKPADLADFPLIECEWPPSDAAAPTWQRWEATARKRSTAVPPLASLVSLSFREELHGIDAVLSGRGSGICSSVVVGRELEDGTLVRVSDISLPGYGFYIVHRRGHPRQEAIAAFSSWLRRTV
jgi:LysR family glycine cleavage system transcriptional activator